MATPRRDIISKVMLETKLEATIERKLIAAGIDDTYRPIVVTPFRGVDEIGCNWDVHFVQKSEVTPHIIEAIRELRAVYNIE